MRDLPKHIEIWEDKIHRYTDNNAGTEPINDHTRRELLIKMLPATEEAFMRTWLWDHADATYPVIKQMIYDRVQQQVANIATPMQQDSLQRGRDA